MRPNRLLAALLAAGLVAGAAAADDPSQDRKLELIRELIALSGAEDASQRLVEVSLAQLEVAYDPMLDEILRSEAELSDEEKETLRRHLADFDRFSTRFRERFAERIDVSALLESVYVPLYAEHFSEQELGEVVAFYRTPTGRKLVRVLPVLVQQGMQRTLPLVEPRVMALVGEILAEQRAELFQ
jgi:hypothetical protein